MTLTFSATKKDLAWQRSFGMLGDGLTETIDGITSEVAQMCGVSVSDLRGPARTKRIAHIRQGAFLEIRDRTGESNSEIGRYFNRDHTTVAWGIEAAQGRIDKARGKP